MMFLKSHSALTPCHMYKIPLMLHIVADDNPKKSVDVVSSCVNYCNEDTWRRCDQVGWIPVDVII